MKTLDPIFQTDADTNALLEHAMTGRPLDPELAQRLRDEGVKLREAIFHKHGLVDVAVPFLRELRSDSSES